MRNTTPILVFLLTIIKFSVLAQQTAPGPVLFKSGNYETSANLDQYVNNPALFDEQSFNNTWYGVFQFAAIPTIEQQNYLKIQGVTIIGYIPNNAYVVSVPKTTGVQTAKQAGVHSLFQLLPEHKMTTAFYKGEIPEWAVFMPGMVDINIELFEGVTTAVFMQTMRTTMVTVLNDEPSLHKITVRIPSKSITEVASSPVVLWIQPILPKVMAENVPGKTLSRSNVLTDGYRNLTGKNVKIGIWDGGVVGPHLDFLNRLSVEEPGTSSDHATHVCGTMAGSGNIDPKARGMASKAFVYGYDFNGTLATEINNSILTKQIVISQHSYGYGDAFVNCTTKDPYMTESREQDQTVSANPYFMHIHSAGNSQGVCTGGWGTTTGKAAKNILVVANVSSAEVVHSSSSCGPVNDGRLKPEISALGVDVYSSTPNNTYTGGYIGTSMATPVVSGVSAQLYERYRQLNANLDPPASLLKAVMCNTAKDVGNAGPDYKYGYGILNGLKAVKTLEANTYTTGSLSQGNMSATPITVPAGATKLKVLLCWTDAAALANASPALVNDLDLLVRNPSNTTVLPWILTPSSPATVAVRGADHLNNSEQVTIDNPTAGTYNIEVTGFAVPSGVQSYSVAWEVETPFMTLTYPMGGEHFVPGSSVTVHWDNAGVTSTQTLQYSTNGGSSWTTISSTIASTLKQYTWTVPSLNGVKTMMRVFSGTLTDDTDSAFSIINTTGALTFAVGCTANDVKISWSAVTGATHYDITSLNSTTGDWDTVAKAITTTTGTVSGLTLGSTYWYSVVARTNTTGAVGERSYAQSYTAPATAIPPPIVFNAVTPSINNVCEGGNVTLTADAQAGTAALASYVFSTNTSAALDPMGSASTIIGSNVDDVPSSPINIGFTFNLGQTDYTQLSVSPDGWVKLGSTTSSSQSANAVISTTNIPKIYPFWDNMATGTTGDVKTQLIGNSPNQIFIVQWFVTLPYNTTGPANTTFQLWLYETSNKIEFRYGTMGATTSASASAGITIGSTTFRSITFSSNTQSASTANNANTTPPALGRIYTFALPAVTNITWSPATFLTATTGVSVNAQNMTTGVNYTVTATDASGCIATKQYQQLLQSKPKVGFTINNTTQPRNTNSFTLTDTTAGNWLTRTWSFGDGNNSTLNPVSKSYTAIGTYNVKLKVNTLVGCTDSIQKQVTVTSSTPTVNANNLQIQSITGTSMQLSWTNGNGQQRIVLARANAAVNTTLADNATAYTANAQFGQGTQLADGSYVVYKGTANTVTVTGLNILSNYQYAVVEFSVDNAINMYQPLPYLTGQATTLPVNWLTFDVKSNGTKTADLNWSTASETNNSHFEIERSYDAKNWITRDRVKGNGTTNLVSRYGYADDITGIGSADVLYYRLKQVDYNGEYAYSAIRMVNLSTGSHEYTIYPNPSNQLVRIDHASINGVEVDIQNLSGKTVYHVQSYLSGQPIDLGEVPAGLYFVRLIRDDMSIHSEKLIIQH
jgi:hypothetical protein